MAEKIDECKEAFEAFEALKKIALDGEPKPLVYEFGLDYDTGIYLDFSSVVRLGVHVTEVDNDD